ncbi:MAG TPA: hypothetical protein VHK91_06070 [Flavisolibacter sp.]|jgi:hypothetical protein|nr:hypothetical protein [Flavisolibacter sp.]
MLKQLFLLAGIILLSSGAAFAQLSFQKGFVVLDKDTLQGEISYRHGTINPQEFSFRQQGQSEIRTLSRFTTAFVSIQGGDTYEQAIVMKDMAPVDFIWLRGESYRNDVLDTIMLRQILKGKRLTLYKFVDFKDQKVHYYIKDGNTNPVELGYKVYLLSDGGLGVTEFKKIYQTQLKAIAGPNDRLHSLINDCNYNERELKRIVGKIEQAGSER